MTAVVPPVTLAHHYELIGHFIGADGVNKWRSSVVLFDSSAVPVDTDAIVTSMIDFWKRNLITTCHYDHTELRAWARGNQPFSTQAALWTSSNLAGFGTKSSGGAYGAEGTEGLGKEVVASVKIDTTGPKPGRLFIRGLLDNGDAAAQAGGQWVELIPGPPNVTNTKFQLILGATIAPYFGTANPGLRVVHFSIKEWNANAGNPLFSPFPSTVADMNYIGPTTNKATRKNPR